MEMKLTYTDSSHTYYLNGKRAKSVSAVAKIPTDTFALEQWSQRQVAIGLAIDPNLVQNVATHLENRERLNAVCQEAKQAARSHVNADRGTQMHRVLGLVLLDQEHKLLTEQQRIDAEVLKRTLDRYRLTPYDALTEQFVAWPHQVVTGRFDAILERPDGQLILVDLKSGPNAVLYPQATGVQLALYNRAPFISDHVQTAGDRSTVTDWRSMPDRLERRFGYVLLVEPDADVGTFHEIDLDHGWAGAHLALQIVLWRKQFDYGKSMVREVPGELTATEQATIAPHLDALRQIWREAKRDGALDETLTDAINRRVAVLTSEGRTA